MVSVVLVTKVERLSQLKGFCSRCFYNRASIGDLCQVCTEEVFNEPIGIKC